MPCTVLGTEATLVNCTKTALLEIIFKWMKTLFNL